MVGRSAPAETPTQRTLLSWERSAFGFLVGGALILIRQHGPLGVGRTLLAVLAGLLALIVLWAGYRRSRHVSHDVIPVPRAEVALLGYGTALFALAISAVLLYSW